MQASCSENQGPMLLAVSYTLLCTAITAVLLRLYVKLGLQNGIKSDDYTITASLVSQSSSNALFDISLTIVKVAGIIGVGCETKFVLIGLGRHIYCLPPEQIPLVLKWSVISQICNIIGIGLAKISVCLCVLRIIGWTRKHLAIFLWLVIAFCAASHFAQVMLFLLQCRPMAAIWDPRIHGACFSPHVTYLAGYIGFGLDGFTDLICAAIPIFILHRLQMNVRTKVALCGLLGLGSLTAGCAIAKAVVLKGVFSSDWTWALWKPAVCTIVEHLTSVTLVSLPTLRPFFNKILEAASSRGVTFKRSVKHSPRWTPAVSGDIYDLDKSLKSDDPEQPTIPLNENEIMRTMEFRLSEHTENGEQPVGQHMGQHMGQRQTMGDYWPLPP